MSRAKKVIRIAAVVLLAIALPVGLGAAGVVGAVHSVYPERTQRVSLPTRVPDYDASKPTVAIVVGPRKANSADVLAPYEVLMDTGDFNVYTVAPERRPITLTGGLDLVPDLDFAGWERLVGHRPDVVIVPQLSGAGEPETAPIEDWLHRQRARGLPILASVCVGAEVLASAGFLDGRPATAHWLGLIGLRRSHPEVKWQEGVRYVDDGDIITGAGVLSGVDVALRIIERFDGEAAARRAAQRVSWPDYSPGAPAHFDPLHLAPADSVALLNAAYRWDRPTVGVLLSDGIGELELASAFRPLTEFSYVVEPLALSLDGAPIRSRHGLVFLPRGNRLADVDTVLVPGTRAAREHLGDRLPEERSVSYLHDRPGFAFDGTLRHIAGTDDVATARWVAKSMQAPDTGVRLDGRAWPWALTIRPIMLALAVVLTYLVASRLLRTRTARKDAP